MVVVAFTAWCMLNCCGFNSEVGMKRAVEFSWHVAGTCGAHVLIITMQLSYHVWQSFALKSSGNQVAFQRCKLPACPD